MHYTEHVGVTADSHLRVAVKYVKGQANIDQICLENASTPFKSYRITSSLH